MSKTEKFFLGRRADVDQEWPAAEEWFHRQVTEGPEALLWFSILARADKESFCQLVNDMTEDAIHTTQLLLGLMIKELTLRHALKENE